MTTTEIGRHVFVPNSVESNHSRREAIANARRPTDHQTAVAIDVEPVSTTSSGLIATCFALGTALLLVGFLLAIAVTSEFQPLILADQAIAPVFFEVAKDHSFVATLASFWHLMGTSNVATPVVVSVLVVLVLARRPGFAAYLVVCSLGGLLISESLKVLVGRARPEWTDPFFTEAGNSFPSGHSLSGICTWTALGIICVHVVGNRGGLIFGWALILFGVLMAPSRLFFGVHWTSDVIAGWAFGLGWTLLVSALFLLLRRRSHAQPK